MKMIILLVIVLSCSSCYYIFNANEPPVLSFKNIQGIRYTEIRREFDNNISIDKYGFHLEPEWRVYFTGDDSAKIFSEGKKQYMSYRIFHSHKNLFQFARRWFRVKHMSRDSIILQAMEVNGRNVNEDASRVYMTLYANNYIKNKLRTTVQRLRAPTANDSLYVKYRAIQANTNPDSAFAARVPVVFKSKSRILRVEKVKPNLDPNLGELNEQEIYLNPVYKIYIDKAYRDFVYSFYAVVDHNGRIAFKRFNFNLMPEFIETKTKVAKGVIDIYLNNLLDVIPGKTLGYPHSSVVLIHVIGVR